MVVCFFEGCEFVSLYSLELLFWRFNIFSLIYIYYKDFCLCMLFPAFMNNCLLFYSLKSCEPEFLVATPERLLELISLKAIDISGVSLLVNILPFSQMQISYLACF